MFKERMLHYSQLRLDKLARQVLSGLRKYDPSTKERS